MIRHLLLCMMLLFAGCQFFNPISPMIQIGMYWVEGEAVKYYNTDQEELHKAIKKVFEELKFPIVDEEVKGNIIYMTVDVDKKFKIKLNAVRDNVTKVSIRVNTFGDKPYAEMVYRHLDEIEGIKQFTSVAKLNSALEDGPLRKRR